MQPSLSYATLLNKVWPIILANAAVPLLGMVDTAVIGHFGSVSELAALAVASLLFSFLYWSFGFLRMSTTSYVAKAEGASDTQALMLVVGQSSVIAVVIAGLLIVLQYLVISAGLFLMQPPEEVVLDTKAYFDIRIWSAPATLLMYVFMGVLIGRGQSRMLLGAQILLNLSNAVFDIVFAGIFSWGIEGIAYGTVAAEYISVTVVAAMLWRQFSWPAFIKGLTVSRFFKGIVHLLSHNTDIFIRTFFLLLSFMLFTRIAAGFGKDVLAANYLLLQIISFSAFFLDGFAYVLESYAGRAIGEKNRPLLKVALIRSSVVAVVTSCILGMTVFLLGDEILRLLTNKENVTQLASTYLTWAAVYITISVMAFQLDGLFIGAGDSSAMRNSSVISSLAFTLLWFLWLKPYGNSGLWLAFNLYVVLRAVTLACYLPRVYSR